MRKMELSISSQNLITIYFKRGICDTSSPYFKCAIQLSSPYLVHHKKLVKLTLLLRKENWKLEFGKKSTKARI